MKCFTLLIVYSGAMLVQAQSSSPATLTPVAAAAPGQVALSWPAVTGALSYNVKRSKIAGGPYALLATVVDTNYTDSSAIFGVTYFYAVTTIDWTGESTGFREVAASPVAIRDNSDDTGVSSTGSWPLTMLAGYYGSNSAYAATTSSGSPISTFTLTPTLPLFGNYDVYHRGGSPPWRMNKITKNHEWAIHYHTYGMEWRTDNTLIHYLDGVEVGRAPASAVNGMACMAPVVIYLSTYAGNYWQPAAALDGQSMKVDYLRCYQKPGWLGAVSSNWNDAGNWGPMTPTPRENAFEQP